MSITRKYLMDRHFVLTTLRDGANERLLKEHVQLLTAETENIHPFVELADASELRDLSGFSVVGTAAAGAFEFERKHLKEDKLAILVSSNDAYELAAGYSATSYYYRYDSKIFKDFKQAIEWLGVGDLENEINELRNG